MKFRTLGSTTLMVSTLGFGSSPFGNVYGDLSTAQAQGAVDAAIDSGVNFFDSSPYYGLTVAEERLGAALAGKRNRVILATKCGRYGVDRFDFSRASIRSSVEASLRRLQTEYVDLLQAHDVEFADERQIVEESIPALRELQDEGKARFIGITGYPLRLLRRIAETAPVDTVLSYCRYALLNTDMATELAPLSAGGTGLINASPLMMGLLTERGAPEWHKAADDLKAAGVRAAAAARAQGRDIANLALQYSCHQEFAATTLVGMATAEQVRQNVATVERSPDPELLALVRKAVGKGFTSTWPSGLPENDD